MILNHVVPDKYSILILLLRKFQRSRMDPVTGGSRTLMVCLGITVQHMFVFLNPQSIQKIEITGMRHHKNMVTPHSSNLFLFFVFLLSSSLQSRLVRPPLPPGAETLTALNQMAIHVENLIKRVLRQHNHRSRKSLALLNIF